MLRPKSLIDYSSKESINYNSKYLAIETKKLKKDFEFVLWNDYKLKILVATKEKRVLKSVLISKTGKVLGTINDCFYYEDEYHYVYFQDFLTTVKNKVRYPIFEEAVHLHMTSDTLIKNIEKAKDTDEVVDCLEEYLIANGSLANDELKELYDWGVLDFEQVEARAMDAQSYGLEDISELKQLIENVSEENDWYIWSPFIPNNSLKTDTLFPVNRTELVYYIKHILEEATLDE